MSDKFFFKGRQDARQNHIKYGFKESHLPSTGNKAPMSLVVTSEERKQAIALMAERAGIAVDISIDESSGASEQIDALLPFIEKKETVRVDKQPARNDPCLCGSGKKFKKCCG